LKRIKKLVGEADPEAAAEIAGLSLGDLTVLAPANDP
jgi:hypothetical protein